MADPGTPTPAGLDVVCSPPPGPWALLMSFPELRQYSRLQISHDATDPLRARRRLSSSSSGCCPALYVSRRKVWVRARPDGSGSIVQVGGFALQRKDRFDEEFVSLVDAIVTAAGGAPHRGTRRGGATVTTAAWARLSSDAFNVALFSYIAAMLASFAYLAFRRDGLHTLATAIGIVGLVANGLSIVTRGIAAERTPWGNMYEYSSLLTFLIVLGYLWVVEARAKVRTVGGFVYAMAVLTMAMAVSFFYVGPTALLPALNSYWRQIHVTSMIVASSLLGVGCLFTIVYLLKLGSERRSLRRLGAQVPPPIMGASIDASDPSAPPDYAAGADEPVGSAATGVAADRAAAVGDAGRAGLQVHPVRVPGVDLRGDLRRDLGATDLGALLGVGPEGDVVVHHLGHLRRLPACARDRRVEGLRAAVVALIGFVSLLITYYAVNLWIAGLHTYAT